MYLLQAIRLELIHLTIGVSHSQIMQTPYTYENNYMEAEKLRSSSYWMRRGSAKYSGI